MIQSREAAEAFRTHVTDQTLLVQGDSCARSRLEESSTDVEKTSDVVSETKGCPSAQILRWDPCPAESGSAEVLGSTYVEPEDLSAVSVQQEKRQMSAPVV